MTDTPPGPPQPEFLAPASTAPAPLPTSVKAIRVILWILVGAAGLLFVTVLALAGDAQQAGAASAWPLLVGISALVLALLSTRRSKRVWIGLLVFESIMVVLALGQATSTGGRSLGTFALHLAILVLVLRRSAREYYRGGSDAPARDARPEP